ncbi:MAG: type VI secretion system contractile sheath domain-containing protein, partial [Lysobacterales bacterium]
MAGHMEFEFSTRGAATTRQRQHPFNLLVLGNFGGGTLDDRANSTGADLASRRILPVDLDRIGTLWSALRPGLALQAGDHQIEFAPRDLDDFHPDHLYRNLPVFQELRALRKRLLDPATAQAALASLLAERGPIDNEQGDEPVAQEASGEDEAGDLFERLLGRPGGQTASPPQTAAGLAQLDTFIRGLVAPHVVQARDPRVDTAVDSVDLATAGLMRGILHQREFQALEASWRALTDLVSELELGEDLQLFVCDIRREELLTALPDPGSNLQESALFQLLVARRQAADDTPWSAIIGDYYFDARPEDIALLTALGAAAAACQAVFLGGARPQILGCSSAAELADAKYWSAGGDHRELWQALRRSPVADHIGLALPRVLGRLPYGQGGEDTDAFRFEEMPERRHEHYLWLNPAWACGRLLAQEFTRAGWDMAPGDHVDLGALPAHHYSEDGESRLQPCAELLLSESTMVAILEQGLMPLVSYRNQNTAVL